MAFIIGNGKSREGFDLRFLKPFGVTYGCNLLFTEYEDFVVPDFTVSIEDYRRVQIREAGFPEDRCVFPPAWECYEDAGYRGPSKVRSNAGMNACKAAIEADHTTLYLLGMDFMLLGNRSITNMFDGKKKVRTTFKDSMARTAYFDWFAKEHPEIKFRFVFDTVGEGFHTLTSPNVDGIFYGKLIGELEDSV